MKKLIILIIILACMGCSEICEVVEDDGISGTLVCIQPEGESCGFLQEWDNCFCECDWIF